jgi:predicted ATPase
MKVYEKFDNKAWLGRVSAWFYGSVSLWKKPVRMIFEPLKNAHRVALETGDIDFAMLNANVYCWESFDICTLPKIEKIISSFSNRMEVYGHESILMMIKPLWQMVHNFMGKAHGDPQVLTGEIMEQEYTVQYARENNKTLLIWSHFYRLLLNYMFGDFESAEVHASVCRVAENNSRPGQSSLLRISWGNFTSWKPSWPQLRETTNERIQNTPLRFHCLEKVATSCNMPSPTREQESTSSLEEKKKKPKHT